MSWKQEPKYRQPGSRGQLQSRSAGRNAYFPATGETDSMLGRDPRKNFPGGYPRDDDGQEENGSTKQQRAKGLGTPGGTDETMHSPMEEEEPLPNFDTTDAMQMDTQQYQAAASTHGRGSGKQLPDVPFEMAPHQPSPAVTSPPLLDPKSDASSQFHVQQSTGFGQQPGPAEGTVTTAQLPPPSGFVHQTGQFLGRIGVPGFGQQSVMYQGDPIQQIHQLTIANHQLTTQNQQLATISQQMTTENRNLKYELATMQRSIKASNNQYRALEAKYQDLKEVKRELHSQMYAKGMMHKPQHPDKHYVDMFEELKRRIENGLVGFALDHSGEVLSETAGVGILGHVQQLGFHGEKSYDFMTNSNSKFTLSALYNNDQYRVLLVRHIAALFLLHRVFEPFAFGLQQDISRFLLSVDDDLQSQDSLESEAVMGSHQVIGKRAIEFARADKGKYESDLLATMTHVLRLLLPLSLEKEIEQVLRGIVQRAIALKTDMVTEKTFFSFIWYDAGAEVDVEAIDARHPQSRDLICAFPGIRGVRSVWGRSIWADKETVTLVKAKVEALGNSH